jgi:tRNA modification GTPase
MNSATYDDTIAAIATPPGVGGVGIVRISGPDAFTLGRSLFRPSHAEADEPPSSHLLTHGHAIDPASGETLDEVLAVFMRAPRTYTREDVVELHAHGGPLVLRRILAAVLVAGARAADPGELTLRAFLNGRLDLAQAEAVQALITSQTDAGRRLALRQLGGDLSSRIQRARDAATGALVRIEASIDFPEDEVPPPDPVELATLIGEARGEVERLLAGAGQGRVLRDGLRVALVGRPNVGKSSLLNMLLGAERAIVTPIAGTTRDTIEEYANVGGAPVHLVDTAGLTPSDDPIERIGVERSRAAARSADLLLLVLDGSSPLTPLDTAVATELRELATASDRQDASVPPVVLVLNKSDLTAAYPVEEARELWPGAPVVRCSALSKEETLPLERALAEVALSGGAQAGEVLVTSARHADALRRASAHLREAAGTLAEDLPLDFVSIDLRAAIETLGEITGETASADLLDRIFAEFCIGK